MLTSKVRVARLAGMILWTALATLNAQSVQLQVSVPRTVRYSGSFHPANGLPVQPMEGVTLSIYREEQGGVPLWQETQNVNVDTEGRYSVLMGATLNDGMPLELFTAGEPRWLGVQFQRTGEVEQPRVLLTSVPYALKAVDADTLGGQPASSYMLLPSATAAGTPSTTAPGTTSAVAGVKSPKPLATSGSANYIGVFTNATDLGNSVMYQLNGNIGISTTAPLISLDARTGSLPQMGIAGTTDYLTFFASDYWGPAIYWDPGKDMRFGKGGAGLYNALGFVEQMRIQSSTGNVGIGTTTPAATLHVNGTGKFAGGVTFGSPVTFASGQTFPGTGTGTITAVNHGTYLTGGGTSGSVTLDVDTTKVPTLGAGTNAFTGNISVMTVNANGWVGIGTGGPPTYPLEVVSTVSYTYGGYGYLNHSGDTGYYSGSNTVPVSLYAAGRIWTGSEFDALSDERLKDFHGNITPDAALNAVMKLQPLWFTWKQNASTDQSSKAGFFAQQVGTAVPEAVTITPGKHFNDEHLLNYDMLTTYAIGAVQGEQQEILLINKTLQEQQAEVDALRRENRELQEQKQHAQQQDETIRQQQEQNRKLEARLAALEALLSSKVPTTGTAGQ